MNYAALIRSINSATTHLQGRAAAAVNQTLVMRNWLVGAYIVEFEQHGKDRAKYGARLLATLAADLAAKGAKGLGFTTLKMCRLFFQTYPAIGQAVLDQLSEAVPPLLMGQAVLNPLAPPAAHPNFPPTVWEIDATVAGKLPTPLKPAQLARISWAHFIELTRLDDPWMRAFYENELLKGHWSVR